MSIEKISMVDALNMETKELMDSYQQTLESMSKEELIAEIGRLLVDKGLLLSSRDGYINELKEDNSRLNGLLADGTEVMDYWQDKYLEEKSKNDELQKQVEQLLEERVTINKNYLQECEEHLKTVQTVKELQKQIDECNRDCEEYAIENGELQQQVDELKKWLNMKEHYIGLIESRLKHSVKDTAKEIYNKALPFIKYMYPSIDSYCLSQKVLPLKDLTKIIRESGVEVE